jgi:hypothetical protein
MAKANQKDQRGGSAAAWAAAAIVLGLGGLGFGVAANLRNADLEARIDVLERSGVSSPSTAQPPAAANNGSIPETTTSTTSTVPEDSGVEPIDPERARSEIVRAFTTFYDGTIRRDVRISMVDDTSGVATALDLVERGPNAVAASSSTAAVESVAFTSATRAAVNYAVSSQVTATPVNRQGEARLVAGTWKVTRATVCADLAGLDSPCS